MAPATRKALDQRNEPGRRLRKGIPALAEMATVFATEEAAVEYLLGEGVLTIPTCPTCGRQCLRKGRSWGYRCQADKFNQSLVSVLVPSILTDLQQLTTRVV
jgi:tRNA(Ile2) C34 agmatinyltransferase TiaS